MEKITKSQVKLVKSLQQKKFRDELGLFVAEGEKCVEELCKGFELEYLIVEDGLTSHSEAVSLLTASRSEIEQMSGLRTPQGVIGVFKKNSQMSNVHSNLTLALDAIQDPGNLGTIIRTCDWFGVHDIVCSLDTADCYNPKVVQATMGALARVHVHYVDLPEWLQSQITNHKSQIPIFGTLLDGKNMYDNSHLSSIIYHLSSVIVMGNEGNGISAAVRKLITHPIRIPSYPADAETSESLNVAVATAIVLAEFRRPK